MVQLVSGVVWLLRKGQVYINQSLQAECDKTQETGTRNTAFIPAPHHTLQTVRQCMYQQYNVQNLVPHHGDIPWVILVEDAIRTRMHAKQGTRKS